MFLKLKCTPLKSILLIGSFLGFLMACTISSGKTAIPPASQIPSLKGNQPTATQRETILLSSGMYDIGNPVLTELWVDPVHGNDDSSGASRDQALRTINAAWDRIPMGSTLSGAGFRIELVAGDYPDTEFPTYWESRHGSYEFPIIIQSADEPGSAHLNGFVNVYDAQYLYLLNLTIATQGDAFHCEKCDHLLIRGTTIDGGDQHNAHETVKINQSQHIFIEGNDISNAYENAIDFVAVQYGHITENRLHDGDDWCIYLKGGSAYFRIEGNEIYNCGTGGFTAGQGSGFEYLVSPWVHYEAYDIKFINNIIHDTQGAGMGVNGGYNILLAYNTLYKVGGNSHVIEVVFGSRSCDWDAERCTFNHSLGGWGPATTGGEGEPMPDRNVFIYNNIIYNPQGFESQWQQFEIMGPREPSNDTHIPSPALTDENLQIRGNIIWNGGPEMALGIEDPSQGCRETNPTCNEIQLRGDNIINILEPQLVNPEGGDFHPTSGGNIFQLQTLIIPDFQWEDAPKMPQLPAGDLSNQISIDKDGLPRVSPGIPGAYTTVSQ
jgi:hypothetical protein